MPSLTEFSVDALEAELKRRSLNDRVFDQAQTSAQIAYATQGLVERMGLQMKYFVLKPEGNDLYAKASRAAMRRYARLIDRENKILAIDLMNWADSEFTKYFDSNESESLRQNARNEEKA